VTLPLAVYGSLRSGLALPAQPGAFDDLLGRREPCLLTGRLVDLGAYPGLVDALDPAGPTVVGELCHLADGADLAPFDAYEGFDPERPETSQYRRRRVVLRRPALEAWTYVYNRAWDASMVVSSGDWAAHLAGRR
jgi:gamma-glutamylcyclotransferase (GGCT)/AIG2-like uncharacterized protein YtfP